MLSEEQEQTIFFDSLKLGLSVIAIFFIGVFLGVFCCCVETGEISMSDFFDNVLVQIIAAVVGAALTFVAGLLLERNKKKKTQLAKLENAVTDLKSSLGFEGTVPLAHDINEKFDKIQNDIGRRDNESLTKQHDKIQEEIVERFSAIEQRYIREDEASRRLSDKQRDVRDTLTSFLKAFTESSAENSMLREKNNELGIEKFRLHDRIFRLEEENRKLKEQLNTSRDRTANRDRLR